MPPDAPTTATLAAVALVEEKERVAAMAAGRRAVRAANMIGVGGLICGVGWDGGSGEIHVRPSKGKDESAGRSRTAARQSARKARRGGCVRLCGGGSVMSVWLCGRRCMNTPRHVCVISLSRSSGHRLAGGHTGDGLEEETAAQQPVCCVGVCECVDTGAV